VPPPPAIWTPAEVLAARERCLVSLSRIEVELDVAPPMRAGQCGTASPVLLKGLGGTGRGVSVHPPALVNCEMVGAIHGWVNRTVQPTARQLLGEEVVRLESVAGYQCRNRAGTSRLSEHALANAIDILGFVTESGHKISVLDDWGPTHRDAAPPASAPPAAASDKAAPASPGTPPLPRPNPIRVPKLTPVTARPVPKADRPATPVTTVAEQFLKRVHERSCEDFKTVLGPEANEDHRNHFHLDLAERKRGAHYCR
jgi:hypothetical protein